MSESTFAARLDRLERENRRWKRLAVIGLLGLAMLALMGQVTIPGGQRAIEVQRLVLRDAEGKVRAALVTSEDGAPGLSLFDKGGNIRAALGMLGDGSAALVFRDQTGRLRASLGTEPNGRVGLHVFDQTQRELLALVVSPEGLPELALQGWTSSAVLAAGRDGSPGLMLFDRTAQQVRAALSLKPDGSSTLRFFDHDGKARASVGVASEGPGGLILTDAAERPRAMLQENPDGTAGLLLADETGPRAILGATTLTSENGRTERRPPSSLVLFGPDAHVIWKAP